MLDLLRTIDRLLRGRFTSAETLRRGRLEIPLWKLVVLGVALGASYGLFMGLYAALRPESPTALQLLASACKVPVLFLLTLVVTLPSLYVCSALAGSRLGLGETTKFLLIGICVNLAFLASLGPVTGFFTFSTESYLFMVVLNVVIYAASGLVGLVFLAKAVWAIFDRSLEDDEFDAGEKHGEGSEAAAGTTGAARPPPPRRAPGTERGSSRAVFLVWTVIYGVVGAQMGWILRPFIGDPDRPFALFRPRESNFFEAVSEAIYQLLGG